MAILRSAAIGAGFTALSQATVLPPLQLAWNQNPEKDISHYELLYGTSPGIYTHTLDAGLETSASVTGLTEGVSYYFVVVARNASGGASPKSAMVTYRRNAPVTPSPNGTISSPAADMTITTGDAVDFSGKASASNGSTVSYLWNFGSGSGLADSNTKSPGSRRFNRAGIYQVRLSVTDSLGKADPTPAVRTIIVQDPSYTIIPRSGWKLKYVDSQETKGYAATAAFDGNANTFWHTRFSNVRLTKEPHEIQIDMGKIRDVSGFQYLPRQDGITVGNVGRFNFYVSKDGKNWGKPVAKGAFDRSTSLKQIPFKTKRGRYIRLQSVTEISGNTDCNVAELQALQLVKPKTTKTAAISPASAAKSTLPAFVLTPASTSSELPPVATTEVIDGKKYRALTVAKPSFPDGVTRTVEVSSDLIDWFSGKKHTTVLIDNAQLLKVRDNTPVTPGEKRYIRLKETGR